MIELATATIVLYAWYPILRLRPGWPFVPFALGLAAQLAAVTTRSLRGSRRVLSPAEVCAALVAASSIAELIGGPWARLRPFEDWYLSHWIDVAALGGIAAVSAWGWWQSRRGVI